MLGYLLEKLRLNKLRAQRRRRATRTPSSEQPMRSELYSSDQMEQHGEFLAESHVQAQGRGPDRLLPRLADNEGVISEAAKLLTDAIAADRRITPAGEWLLDNFYIIQEQ